MAGSWKFAKERLATQGSPNSRKVWGLSFSDNSKSNFTLVSKIIRSLSEKGILFPEPLASMPLKEEEGEVVTSHRANDDFALSTRAL